MQDSLSTLPSKSYFMKKFLTYIIVSLVVLIAADLAFGKLNMLLEAKVDTRNYHCTYSATEDILILGSSYGVKEIVPQTVSDQTGLTCYNAAEPGNGAICAWIRYNMFIRNHTPKIILYALTPGYDYVHIGDDYNEYLKSFRGYYGKEPAIKEMYELLGEANDSYKLRSNFAKYNSEWLTTMFYAITGKNKGLQGYMPFHAQFTPYEVADTADVEPIKVDEKKFRYFENLMRDATKRGIKVVCFLPPHYYNTYHAQSHERALTLCKELNIPVIDNYNDAYYKDKPELFGDKEHLNVYGAEIYTKQLCDSITKFLK